MSSSLKQKILSGVLWQGLEKFGNQGISFLISVILARLLAPEEFGVLAILMIFTNFCSIFIDAGFTEALIQKKDLKECDCCSVFFMNIVASLFLYVLIYFCAPLVAAFYKTPQLSLYLRVIGIILVTNALGGVQRAMLIRKMMFHLTFRISWTAQLCSGTVAIIMAYHGFGVWALIVQQLISSLLTTSLGWLLIKWHPKLLFAWNNLRILFNFGGKLFAAGFPSYADHRL